MKIEREDRDEILFATMSGIAAIAFGEITSRLDEREHPREVAFWRENLDLTQVGNRLDELVSVASALYLEGGMVSAAVVGGIISLSTLTLIELRNRR